MVEGLDRFNRRMNAIPKRMREAVAEEMEKTAAEIVDKMRALAPKGRSQRLVNSIGWTWGDAPKGAIVLGSVRGTRRRSRGKNVGYAALRITIYAGGGSAFYAKFHEFGTVKMAASPFFYPSWRLYRRRVKSRINRAMKRALKP